MISVKDLVFSYSAGWETVLKNISFDVEDAEIFGFLGPSGAGKSTTQKVLTGVLKDYSGSVMLMGSEIRTVGKSFYENIGVAFEFPNLYLKFTAMENLALFASFYRCEKYNADELMRRVGLWEDRDMPVEAYSKGMRMRLNFVRAVLHNFLNFVITDAIEFFLKADQKVLNYVGQIFFKIAIALALVILFQLLDRGI